MFRASMSGPAGRKILDEDQLSRARGYNYYIVASLASDVEISCFPDSFAVYEPTTRLRWHYVRERVKEELKPSVHSVFVKRALLT